MSLKLISGPAVEPISLHEAKEHCRVEHTDEDALLTSMIRAVRRLAEARTNRALVSQVWELALDSFPEAEVRLEKPTVLGITSVKYLDPDGVEQTLDPAEYVLDAATLPGLLLPVEVWPETYDDANAVKIRFTAGYGATASDVPEDIKAWMLLQLATLYTHREAFTQGRATELPNRFTDALLDGEKVYL